MTTVAPAPVQFYFVQGNIIADCVFLPYVLDRHDNEIEIKELSHTRPKLGGSENSLCIIVHTTVCPFSRIANPPSSSLRRTVCLHTGGGEGGVVFFWWPSKPARSIYVVGSLKFRLFYNEDRANYKKCLLYSCDMALLPPPSFRRALGPLPYFHCSDLLFLHRKRIFYSDCRPQNREEGRIKQKWNRRRNLWQGDLPYATSRILLDLLSTFSLPVKYMHAVHLQI